MPTKFEQRNSSAGKQSSASLANPYSKSKDYLSLSTGSIKKEKTPAKMPKSPAVVATTTTTTAVVKPTTSNKVKEMKAANKLKKLEARGNKRADIIAGTREKKKMSVEKAAAITGALGGALGLFDQAKKSFSKKTQE